jgi:hypothetical protein
MKKSTKTLYLPGTNKNVGYILGNTMHIYKKYIKYFPVDVSKNYMGFGVNTGKKFIVANDSDQLLELARNTGWYYEIETKLYTFFDCVFKTPDNLDVIEMVYLYKNWSVNKKKKNGTF